MTNPAVAHVLRFFDYGHLPPHLQSISAPFRALAEQICASSDNPETTVALRKLLESKDAAVRAVLVQGTSATLADKLKDDLDPASDPRGPSPCPKCGQRVSPNSKYLCPHQLCPNGLGKS